MSVVVVGAGLAGLTAATEHLARGADVIVLEARGRVGGRTYGIEVAPGQWADCGAAYLGDRHTELTSMIQTLGLATVATTMTGLSRFAFGDGPKSIAGRFPPLNAVALGDLFDLLYEMITSVRTDAPWLTPDAGRLDRLTVAEWLDRHNVHDHARLFFPLFLGEMMAADPADVSVLHMAFYLHSGGGIRYLNAFEGGAQAARVDGGAHQLCDILAAKLGDRVLLNQPVRWIGQEGDRVPVRTDRAVHDADAVVVAVPPLLADAIEFCPALPVRRATAATGRGCAIKVHLVYPRPLWRDQGLSGWSVSADGPLLSTVDDSPPGGVGVLTGFTTGRQARAFGLLNEASRRATVLAQVRDLFPGLPAPAGFHVTDWINEQYSRGCYASLFGPGDWLALGPHLSVPHGRVHWAGTEISTEFFGLMEGAIRSGRRVAAEITSLLARTTTTRLEPPCLPNRTQPSPPGDAPTRCTPRTRPAGISASPSTKWPRDTPLRACRSQRPWRTATESRTAVTCFCWPTRRSPTPAPSAAPRWRSRRTSCSCVPHQLATN
jgi:monoamine oxidase